MEKGVILPKYYSIAKVDYMYMSKNDNENQFWVAVNKNDDEKSVLSCRKEEWLRYEYQLWVAVNKNDTENKLRDIHVWKIYGSMNIAQRKNCRAVEMN